MTRRVDELVRRGQTAVRVAGGSEACVRFARTLAVLFVAVAALPLGCDDSAPATGLGAPCSSTSDCQAPLVCDFLTGTCQEEGLRDVASLDWLGSDTTSDADNEGVGDVDSEVLVGACDAGAERECGHDIGVCATLLQRCVDGQWGSCTGVEATDELCDGLDNDCDGRVDEELVEACGVTRGICVEGVRSCSGGTWTPCKGAIDPTTEVCDGLDNDCDGDTDEDAVDQVTAYVDADADTFGDVATAQQACPQALGALVLDATDCDDGDATVHPDAAEVCDGLDNDCDSLIDRDDPDFIDVPVTLYRDADGDTFGDPNDTAQACGTLAGYVRNNSDCDDTDLAIKPGAAELCDNLDNDCDATSPDGADESWLGVACDGPADTDLCPEGNEICTAGVRSCLDTSGNTVEVCDGSDNDCDGSVDEGVTTTYYADRDADGYGDAASPGQGCASPPAGYVANDTDCDDTRGTVHPLATEVCANNRDDDCDGDVDENCGGCDPAVDADFDGANQCDDCDDTNGAIFPAAAERCNGLDDDCDDLIDEDFDVDLDTYSVCATDPLLKDCDDSLASVHPNATEVCGNGLDDNCNGYTDEGCGTCNATDTDGDGVSECGGDCAPADGTVFPGAPELCDGKDTDCNRNTVDNCGVSQACNWPNPEDVCRDDLLCVCVLNQAGNCSGNYQCTAFCNSSATGPIGDGCAADETCGLDLLRSANVHGCNVIQTTLGTKAGGESCSGDAQCRSNACDKLCVGPGCNATYCTDYCGSDAYCGTGAVCFLDRATDNMDGRCWPAGGPFLGTTAVGSTCTADTGCDHGFCATVGASRVCTEACCQDSDCPSGYTCSLAGDQVDTSYVVSPPGAPTCAVDADCPSDMFCPFADTCYIRLTETSPMCLRDVTGQGTRPAGAACSANQDCQSNFCERDLGVCVATCCSDDTCPTGLTCELQIVETRDGADGRARVTEARTCVNQSSDAFYRPM